MSVQQFIDHYGTRHALNYAGHSKCDAPLVWSVTLHVRDCSTCYGPSPDFSSSTLTDLQKLTDELDRARDIAVRLEQENAVLVELVEDLAGHGLRHDLTPTTMNMGDAAAMYSWFAGYMRGADQQLRRRCRAALVALAAAPVDGAE